MGCCVSLNGIIRGCDNSIGGIRRAWATCDDEAGKPTISNDIITAIPDPEAWSEYEFRKQTGSVTQTGSRDDATGSQYWNIEIVLQFSKQETEKRLEINAIALSDSRWIIEDNNGRYWYFGHFYPVTIADGATAETGTAFDDFNGYNITLTTVSDVLAYEVSEKAMEDFLK
ncbi:MAG: hypothetical protein LIP08_07940 [Bacteroides sp.]|nr:hypothetical protein [Bacteroides sp.]